MDFRRLASGRRFLLVAAPLEEAAKQLRLLEPGGLERLLGGGGGRAGRGRTAVVQLPGRPERLHLRPVRHGGLLGPRWGDLLLGLRRPIAELRVNERLAAGGAPVPQPALVVGRRRVGPVWTAAVGTIHEEGTLDGVEFLTKTPSRERVLRASRACGDAVRRLHSAGGRHADLHLGNVLIRERGSETEVLVVDLDKARVVPALDAGERMAELMRLYRSLVKRNLLGVVAPRGCSRFLSAYTAGDRDLRRALLAHLPRERARVALHALGYRRRRARSRGVVRTAD